MCWNNAEWEGSIVISLAGRWKDDLDPLIGASLLHGGLQNDSKL